MFDIVKFDFPVSFPNPNHPLLNFDWGELQKLWIIYSFINIVIVLVFFITFYFFTKPNPKGVKRFFLLSICCFIISSSIATLIIYSNKDNLFNENINWTFIQTLLIFISGLISTLELYLIIWVIFLLLSLIPFKWQLRAMRRYPFSFIP